MTLSYIITWHHVTFQNWEGWAWMTSCGLQFKIRMPKGPLCFVHFLTFQSSKFGYGLASIFSRTKTALGSFCCILSIETTRYLASKKPAMPYVRYSNAICKALNTFEMVWVHCSFTRCALQHWLHASCSWNLEQQNLQHIFVESLLIFIPYKRMHSLPIATLPLVQSWEV